MGGTVAGVLFCIAGVLVPTAPANAAPAEAGMSASGLVADVRPMATGQYEYICQMPNGQSWSLAVGEKTTDCKGSYLQKYINGRMIGNYKLVYGGGTVYSGSKPFPWGCAFAVGSAYALIFYPPTSATAWVVVGSLAAGGLVTSCTV